MQSVRIIEIPKCKMVSSGTGMFGQDKFTRYYEWFTGLPKTIYPKDYLYHNGEGFCWLYLYDESLEVPQEFKIIDFEGGLYSVATDIDQKTDMEAMQIEVDKFLEENSLMRDDSRFEMGNIITSPTVCKTIGYNQMDYYTPVKAKL